MATFSVRRSSSAPVVMMEATEYGKGLYAALNLGRSGNGLLMGESLRTADDERSHHKEPPTSFVSRMHQASPAKRAA